MQHAALGALRSLHHHEEDEELIKLNWFTRPRPSAAHILTFNVDLGLYAEVRSVYLGFRDVLLTQNHGLKKSLASVSELIHYVSVWLHRLKGDIFIQL